MKKKNAYIALLVLALLAVVVKLTSLAMENVRVQESSSEPVEEVAVMEETVEPEEAEGLLLGGVDHNDYHS